MNYAKALETAKALKSEHGENPEYDRALVELLSDGYEVTKQRVADELGVDFQKLYFPGATK